MMTTDGFVVFGPDPKVVAWAKAAKRTALRLSQDPEIQTRQLRHGNTWFVGVDVLPNDPSGAVAGVPLTGPWQEHVPDLPLHRAQVSIIYPGYPQQDADQSDANHRFRIARMAAHVDGLLPEGPDKRRYAREFHAYILGIPLSASRNAPTVVWKGSHRIIRQAFEDAIGDKDPSQVDLTDAYHAARRVVFETCEPLRITAPVGGSFLIHRLAVHGTAPWDGPKDTPRIIAFFRPEYPDAKDWLSA